MKKKKENIKKKIRIPVPQKPAKAETSKKTYDRKKLKKTNPSDSIE